MLTNFLDIGNVQSDLKNMDREQQKQTLRSFRQAMGLDQAALNRWETLDEQRAQQRTVGQQYMEQRKALETKYQGDSLNQQINVLRVNLFGESEAKYLANEEASGFFRFEHEQKIGLN